ncbi:sugar transferase [Aureimonas glaciei]|nr:sugar transferase [Aureimonas glaciei]
MNAGLPDLRCTFLIADLIVVFVASILAVNIRDSSFDALFISPYYWIFATFSTLIALLVWLISGLSRRPWQYFTVSDIIYLVFAVTAVVVIAIFIMFTLNRSDFVARSVPFLQWILSLTLLVLVRVAWRYMPMAKDDGNAEEMGGREYILLVGYNPRSEIFLQCIEALYANRASVVGILDDHPRSGGLMLKGKPVIGHSSMLAATLMRFRNHGIEIARIVMTTPEQQLSAAFQGAVAQIRAEGVVRVERFEGLFGFDDLDAHPVTATRAQQVLVARQGEWGLGTPRGRYLAAKRVFDFVTALTLILVLAPVYLLLAGLVAKDLGSPIAFWQERPGFGGRPFRVYKFRTMRDAYDLDGKEVPEAERLSSIGRALRRLRLDELPQLFNILLGHMSFVGPRPLLPVDQPGNVAMRLSMRPGLTGWAQVNGGRHLSLPDKGALDFWYIENAGPWIDARIIFLTLRFVLGGEKPPAEGLLQDAYGLVASRAAEADPQSRYRKRLKDIVGRPARRALHDHDKVGFDADD